MKKKYKIESIELIPNVVVYSIIQIWLAGDNAIIFVEDRARLDKILEKYQIDNEITDVYNWSHLKGCKCEVSFDEYSQIKSFNYL